MIPMRLKAMGLLLGLPSNTLVYIHMNKKSRPFVLIIYGPTAVGKTDLALAIAERIPSEIINMDVGQFYAPLSIGTAKPDWKNSAIPHHMFDVIDQPIHYTVHEYRAKIHTLLEEIRLRKKLPILVGGSGFYLYSLLFSQPMIPVQDIDTEELYKNKDLSSLWQQLYTIDPTRALAIEKTDEYRIKRALEIWYQTGKLPSSMVPVYDPAMDYMLLFVERERQELKNRIDQRVIEMINSGWIDEAKSLRNTAWEPFIKKKNIIGYSEIFNYLSGEITFDRLIELICIRTKQYAKRQFTFWRKLEREIKKEKRYTDTHIGCLEVINLTNVEIHLYINKLLKRLIMALGENYE